MGSVSVAVSNHEQPEAVAVPNREQSLMVIELRPDWTGTGTATELEACMEGFKFKGPGWYIGKSETVLVVPHGPCSGPWKQKWPEDMSFVYHCYSQNPLDAFNAVVNAPTRADDR